MESPASIRYVVITPVRDESAHIEATIRSMMEQTVRPVEWVIVDDGSTDGTSAILDRFATEHSWITVLHKTNRGHRDADTGAVGAFLAGYHAVRVQKWDFVVNLDADLGLGRDYFQKCFEEFRRDPRLGIGGGTLYHYDREGKSAIETSPKNHVRGATKIYRRACWESFGGLREVPGWDTLDEIQAETANWCVRSFEGIVALHLRPTGGAAGAWRDAVKNGRADYFLGYHPVFMLAKCLRRLPAKPLFIDGVGHFWGFVNAYRKGLPQANKDTVRYLRRKQMGRLCLGKLKLRSWQEAEREGR